MKHKVRGVEIEAVRASAADVEAEMIASEEPLPGAAGPSDEGAVRAACARALVEAQVRRLSSVALPAFGARPGGISLVAVAKIMVQEAIRVARAGPSSVRRIVLCFPLEDGFETFSRTVNGYVKHFLDVLLWGPFLTVDAVIEVSGGIVLVQRSNPPLGFALPGGFVDYGESLEEAVRREAREETGLELLDLEQLHTYSDPHRDPRFHTVTTVFMARADGTPRAGDDAAAIRVAAPAEVEGLSFAFDHAQVLHDYLARRAGAEKTSLPEPGRRG
ncbi:MAG: NUDIX domain-containing protein [Spirochaetia bacterium]|jgi:ADP-ribose pyrophosphatase YjhB (NUDIX family)